MDNQNQAMPSGLGQQQPWMLYTDAQPEESKGLPKWVFIIGAVIVLLIIAIICVLVIGNNKKKETVEPISDAGIETHEMIVGDTGIAQKFIDAAKIGAHITRSECRKLVNIGNKYVKTYGGTEVDASICSQGTIRVAQAIEDGKDYPYEPMTVIYLQSGNQCLKFPFYASLYSIQGYEASNKVCPVATRLIEVIK